MPRAPWVRRRRTTDSPRPAGRRWAGRLRRSGSLARQMLLVRVGRRGGPHRTSPAPERGASPAHASGGRALTSIGTGGPATIAGRQATAEAGAHATTAQLRGLAAPAAVAQPGRPVPLLPGERSGLRWLRFALVNACTLASLGLGMSAIFLGMRGAVHGAAACLVGCVLFDGLDGGLARRLGVASPFGAQMDSLADMCSFGVAAPVVVYASMHATVPAPAIAAACVLVAACAAIRLARFNVSPKDGRFFTGVPTTMTAAVLGLATLIGLRLPAAVAVGAVALLALAMVSSFPYAKLARLARLPVWLWFAAAVGAFLDYRITFLALVALYLASGPLVWLRQRLTGAG